MGGKSKPTTTTTKTEPWDASQPYYKDLYSQAAAANAATPKTPFEGAMYAAPNAMQTQALQMFRDQAMGAGAGADQVRQLGLDTLSGKYMDPNSNPWLKGAVDAATGGVQQQLMRQVLPALQDQSIQQGAYGGAGYGVAQGQATSDFTKQALDIANQVYASNYAAERQNQLQAPTLLQAATAIGLQPAQLLDAAGSQQQGWDQAAINAQIQKYQMAQQAPWAGISNLSQVLNGGGFSSGGSTVQPGTPSGFASALQGVTGAAGTINSLFPKALPAVANWFFPPTPPQTTGLGNGY